jgi:hypothetical protein
MKETRRISNYLAHQLSKRAFPRGQDVLEILSGGVFLYRDVLRSLMLVMGLESAVSANR